MDEELDEPSMLTGDIIHGHKGLLETITKIFKLVVCSLCIRLLGDEELNELKPGYFIQRKKYHIKDSL